MDVVVLLMCHGVFQNGVRPRGAGERRASCPPKAPKYPRRSRNNIKLNVLNAQTALRQARAAYETAVVARKLQEQTLADAKKGVVGREPDLIPAVGQVRPNGR